MKMLALYLRDECKLKPSEIKRYLLDFITKHCTQHLNESEKIYRVENILKYARNKKNVLIQIEGVKVYAAELEWLKNLDVSSDAKKVIFATIVQKRFDAQCYLQRHPELQKADESYFLYLRADREKINSIKKAAHISANVYDVFHELYEQNMIDTGYNYFTLKFFNDIALLPQENEGGVEVEFLSAAGLYWREWLGDASIKRCAKCGMPIQKASNRQKWCAACSENRQEDEECYQGIKRVCSDCGIEFWAEKKSHSHRCPPCQKRHWEQRKH